MKRINDLKQIQEKSYLTENGAAAAWANQYRRLSENNEFAAFIYSTMVEGEKRYCFGRTYTGMKGFGMIRANVIIPFTYLYMVESVKLWLSVGAAMEAFIHTHPKPQAGFTMRFHSREDLALLKLYRIKAVYVIPFENDEVNLVTR